MQKDIQENLLNIVKTNYEEAAEEFDRSRQGLVWPELDRLAGVVAPYMSVLDIGCGNGRLLNSLPVRAENYLGVDLSANLIVLAKNNYPNHNFLVADVLDLGKIEIGQFDFIFAIAMLHHLPGQDLQVETLDILADKLSLGGTMVVSVQNFWAKKKYRVALLKATLRKLIGLNHDDFGDIVFTGFHSNSKRYYHAFTMCGLKKISRKANLRIVKLYKDKFNYYLILRKD